MGSNTKRHAYPTSEFSLGPFALVADLYSGGSSWDGQRHVEHDSLGSIRGRPV